MRDRLDVYWQILGPHAAELEPRVSLLAKAMADRDLAWYRRRRSAEVSRHGDPFPELESIVKETWRNRLEYAAQRVAVAAAAEQLPEPGPEQSFSPLPKARELLDAYAAELGSTRAQQVRVRAKAWYRHVREQTDGWVWDRTRELVDPYPAQAAIARPIGHWVNANRAPAAMLFALDRAEQAELGKAAERADVEVGRTLPPPAPSRGAEPAVEALEVDDASAPALQGDELAARIEERRKDLEAELGGLSEEELSSRAEAHERGFAERAAALRAEVLRLESLRTGAPVRDQLLRRAVDAELDVRDPYVSPVDRAASSSKADYMRQLVRDDRRVDRAIEGLRSEWIDLHAEEAALRAFSERSPALAGPDADADMGLE